VFKVLIQVLKGCRTGVVVEKIDFILIFAKIREKVCCSADMCYSGGRHPPAAGAELKILIFGADGSSIRPLGTINLPKLTTAPEGPPANLTLM